MKKYKELLFLQQIKGYGKVTINRQWVKELPLVEEMSTLRDSVLEADTRLVPEAVTVALEAAERKYEKYTAQADLKILTCLDEEYPKGLLDMGNNRPVIIVHFRN